MQLRALPPNPQKTPTGATRGHDHRRAATPDRRIPGLLQQRSPPPGATTPHTHRGVQRPAQGIPDRLPDPPALPRAPRQNRRRRRHHHPLQQPPAPHRFKQATHAAPKSSSWSTTSTSASWTATPEHSSANWSSTPPATTNPAASNAETHPKTGSRCQPCLGTSVNDVPRHHRIGTREPEPDSSLTLSTKFSDVVHEIRDQGCVVTDVGFHPHEGRWRVMSGWTTTGRAGRELGLADRPVRR